MSIFSKLFGPDPETEKQTAFEEIERQFEGAEINQAKAGWLTVRGNNYAMSRKFDMAISDFKGALEYEPNRPLTLVSLGVAYTHNKMWQDGITTLGKARQALPSIENKLFRVAQEHNLHYSIGHAYFFMDNKKLAIEHLNLSLEAMGKLMILIEEPTFSNQDKWVAQQLINGPTVKNTRRLLSNIEVRQTIILGKRENWNSEAKCDVCKKSTSDNVWDIKLRNSSDTTRKNTELFFVCEQCYGEKYGIYPSEERKIPTLKDYIRYSKLSSVARNREFFKIFPKEFWEKIQVNETEVLSLINFILDGKSDFDSMPSDKVSKVLNENSVKIINQIDEYTKKAARGSFTDEFMVPKNSKTGEEVLFYDITIPDKFSTILTEELFIFGTKMLNVLSMEKKSELLKKFKIKDFNDDKFLWDLYMTYAPVTVTALLEDAGVFKRTITPTFPFMIVEKIGLLKYLHWLRKFGVSYEITAPAENLFYPLLLSQ